MLSPLNKLTIVLFGPYFEYTPQNSAEYTHAFNWHLRFYTILIFGLGVTSLIMSINLIMVAEMHFHSPRILAESILMTILANVTIVGAIIAFMGLVDSSGHVEQAFLIRHTPNRKIKLRKMATAY